MSTTDRLLLFLHIGFAIFTLGPLTAATMASPRYIRKGDVVVLRYLIRITRIYGLGSLGIFLFGLFLAKGRFDQMWLSASMTLFVVALVLLLLVERDQRKAAHALELARAEGAASAAPAEEAGEAQAARDADAGGSGTKTGQADAAPFEHVAQVERGRIAALSGVVALLWLVILVLMIWNG
ncbi:hypothetical protein Arub01_03470 [Actinomadura rubrobrunea]|uniref:DUF2269 family protein n=1 Tax=Actinomadura rubrobrunea TaxID=115335 RepID=A0A9W6UTS6_9ACTN|nr:hypothetical protein [Actinomadura rubrobrunea]GLW62103.1 hypothetical protein Arub01_03470 [Actinomadura rubrobrunea]